ncbi:MAG TPA: MSMEG_0567/Sll0786 family nitrogen starvation N-acetyltransferase [Euzebyales bacterium]|nr:MSMEG_0567/Sll0786 family nitrogen starvation N-acetyltransferase [Euzebyales bacterium]
MLRPALVSPFSASADEIRRARKGPTLSCRAAADDELALHWRIRHEVFVDEQGVFDVDDRDEFDDRAGTVHALGLCGPVAAGTVRFYPLSDPRLWKGDRLAVLPPFRSLGLGGPLVRFAVHTAGTLGGEQMIAYIQPQNVAVFEHLGWRTVGPLIDYVGQPHQKMLIDLLRSDPPHVTLVP